MKLDTNILILRYWTHILYNHRIYCGLWLILAWDVQKSYNIGLQWVNGDVITILSIFYVGAASMLVLLQSWRKHEPRGGRGIVPSSVHVRVHSHLCHYSLVNLIKSAMISQAPFISNVSHMTWLLISKWLPSAILERTCLTSQVICLCFETLLLLL